MAKSIRPQLTYPISLRKLTVRRVYDVSAGMRRVELEGAELLGGERDGFTLPPFASDGFDDELKVFYPDPDTGKLSLPVQRDRFIDWPRDPRAESRTYTVRDFDAAAGVLTLDFARHARGVATDWAETVAPGAEIHIAGPKMAWLEPEGADWLFIGGDDTAIPALARWLETMPRDARGVALLEVDDAASEFEIDHPPGMEVRWLHRAGVPAARSTALIDAVLAEPWRDGDPFCWFAGETGVLRPIRTYLRKERELDRERVEVTGYWRAPVGDDLDADIDDDEHADLHHLGDLVPPFALRAAITLGIGPALRGGPRSTTELAEALGAHGPALARLLRYLATIELLEERDGGWALTRAGGALDDESETGGLDLADPRAREQLALGSLLDVVRTGQPVGGGRAVTRRDDEALDTAIVASEADDLSYVASSFGSAEVSFAAGEHVTVAGDGALAVLAGPLASDAALRVTLLERPSRVSAQLAVLPEALRDRVEVIHGTGLDSWPNTDGTTLLVGALRDLPDADAAHLLRGAAASSGRLLVFETLLGIDEIDDHDAGDDLLALCVNGVGLRTRAELEAVVEAAGLRSVARAIGWGELLLTLAAA
ncbi:siderophore-interacting protein [Leucobacter albus]|uniref:Siderophore-interacting protein n=1 Tax=Leucobacter albus TaxID=272210 RepID=A0ABW3TPT2_9MICO